MKFDNVIPNFDTVWKFAVSKDLIDDVLDEGIQDFEEEKAQYDKLWITVKTFSPGDKVLLIEGDLKGQTGKIIQIKED